MKEQILLELENCNDPIVLRNVLMLLERANVGFNKYGTDLSRGDLTHEQWQKHLLEELLDASNYLQKLMSTK